MTTRRRFIACLPAAGLAGLAAPAGAADLALDPKDPKAVAHGYVVDATKADRVHHPRYQPGQACAGCALYQPMPGTASGRCPIYRERLVPAGAWCDVFIKRG